MMKMMNEDKFMDDHSCKVWLSTHTIEFDRFLFDNFHPDDYGFTGKRILSNPKLGQKIVSDYLLSNDMKVRRVMDYISHGSLIILVIGQRGEGKSCTVHWVCRYLHDNYGKDVYYVGPPMDVDDHFHHVYDIYDSPENTINVIDESALISSSRKSMSAQNMGLTEILPTLRHVGKTVFVITQNSSMTDINFFKLADVLMFKKFSLMQENTERAEVMALSLYAPRSKPEVLFYSDSLITKFTHGVHSDWTDKLSRCYRSIGSEVEAEKYARSLYDQEYKIPDIKSLLKVKGFKRDTAYFKNLLKGDLFGEQDKD